MSLFNSEFLASFNKSHQFSKEHSHLIRSHQRLTIIYINFALLIFTLFFEFILWKICTSHLTGFLLMISIFFNIFSYITLKKANVELAAAILLPYMHILCFMLANYSKQHLIAMLALPLVPAFLVFLTSDRRIYCLNGILCFSGQVYHSYQIEALFNTAVVEELKHQTIFLTPLSFGLLGCVLVNSFMFVSGEAVLLKIAKMGYEKSENMANELNKAVSSKDVVLHSLSNDIREPLKTLNKTIDHLMEVIKDLAQVRILKKAKNSGQILLNLVNDYLDDPKKQLDIPEVNNVEADINEIIRTALAVSCESIKKPEVTVNAFIDKNIPQRLWLDSSRLLQIITNLLTNSLQKIQKEGKIIIRTSWAGNRSDKNTLRAQLQVSRIEQENHVIDDDNWSMLESRSKADNNSIRIASTRCSLESVECDPDNSNVCREPNRSKKFNLLTGLNDYYSNYPENQNLNPLQIQRNHSLPFQPLPFRIEKSHSLHLVKKGFLKIQVSDTSSFDEQADLFLSKAFENEAQSYLDYISKLEEQGLRLWLCKRLCRKLGGDIKYYKDQAGGVSFVFYIPVNNEHYNRCLSDSALIKPKKLKALVVDDYVFNRDLHKLLLEKEGVQVTVASDGREAIEEYTAREQGYYDFIFMDVSMPIMDGFTASRKIREFESNHKWEKGTKIFFISGDYFSEDDILKSLKLKGTLEDLGMRFFRKPLDFENVKKILESFKASQKLL